MNVTSWTFPFALSVMECDRKRRRCVSGEGSVSDLSVNYKAKVCGSRSDKRRYITILIWFNTSRWTNPCTRWLQRVISHREDFIVSNAVAVVVVSKTVREHLLLKSIKSTEHSALFLCLIELWESNTWNCWYYRKIHLCLVLDVIFKFDRKPL